MNPLRLLRELNPINWDDTGSILPAASRVFDQLAHDPTALPTLLDRLADDPHLANLCERYDFVDKLVIADAPDLGVRLRLHLYRPGYFDRPHNHRWSFAARILHGRYAHRIYGRDDHFTEDTDPATLQPIHERIETPSSTYALHHTSVHSVQADAGTLTALLRGPAAKDRFLILDRTTRTPLWAYGAAQESPAQRAAKQMTRSQLQDAVTRISKLLTTAPRQTTGTETR